MEEQGFDVKIRNKNDYMSFINFVKEKKIKWINGQDPFDYIANRYTFESFPFNMFVTPTYDEHGIKCYRFGTGGFTSPNITVKEFKHLFNGII